MSDRPVIRDLDVLRNVEAIRAVAHEERLALLGFLSRGRWTCARLAEETGIPGNRVHYHLRRLASAGLVVELAGGRRQRSTERFYTASARHFIVDPGLGLRDPGMVAAIDSSLETMLLDWRRDALLHLDGASLARRIAVDCARVRAGETVLLAYGRYGTELGEAVLVELEAIGARPVVKPWSANWLVRTLDRRSEEDLSGITFLPADVTKTLDAAIFISTNVPESPPLTPEQSRRLPAMLAAMSRWQQAVHARGVRHVEFSLPFRGEFEASFGPPEDGATVFWRAVMADLDAVGQLGGRLHERLASSPRLRMGDGDGTALELTLDPATTLVRDGVVTGRDVASRRSSETLPSGSLLAIPVPESVNGVFACDYAFWSGVHALRPRLTIEKGRIVHLEAASQSEFLRQMLRGAKGEADLVAMVSFGLNPAGRGPTGKTSLDACLEGTVTLTFGNNEIIGGSIASTLVLSFPHSGLSVEAGGRELLRDGVYQWGASPPDARTKGRYARSGLGPSDIDRLAAELRAILAEERPFLDPDLGLSDLAGRLAVSRNHLSQVLRQGIGKTFQELINELRVEEFQRRVVDPENSGLTHLAIALDSGFPSKASFYRNFKQVTGKTPAEYLGER